MNMDNVAIHMTYSPTPVKVNEQVQFTFHVKNGTEFINMLNYSCYTKMETMSSTNLNLSQQSIGTYSGSTSFTTAGTYNVSLNFTIDNMEMSKNFTIKVE